MIRSFELHLRAERNLSPHTRRGYLADVRQLAEFTLGRWLGRRPLIVPAHPQADTGSHRWKGALKHLAPRAAGAGPAR